MSVRLLDVVAVRDYPISWPNSQIAHDVARLLDVPVTTFGASSDYDVTSNLAFWCAHFRAWGVAAAAARRRSRPSRRHYVAFHVPCVDVRRSELEAELFRLLGLECRPSTSAPGAQRRLNKRDIMILATSNRDTLAYTCSTSRLRRMCRPDSLIAYLGRDTRFGDIDTADAPPSPDSASALPLHTSTHTPTSECAGHDANDDTDSGGGRAQHSESGRFCVAPRAKTRETKDGRARTRPTVDDHVTGGVRVDERASKRCLSTLEPALDGCRTQRQWNLLSDRVIRYSRFVRLAAETGLTETRATTGDADRVTEEAQESTQYVDRRVSARHVLRALADAIQPPFHSPRSMDRRRITRLRDRIRRQLDAGTAAEPTTTTIRSPQNKNTSIGELSTYTKHCVCAYLATWARDTLYDSTWITYFVELASTYASSERVSRQVAPNEAPTTGPEHDGDDRGTKRRLRKGERDSRWGGCVLALRVQAHTLASVDGDWKAAARLLENASARISQAMSTTKENAASLTTAASEKWTDELVAEYQVAMRNASALGVAHDALRCEWQRLRASAKPLKRDWQQFDRRVHDIVRAGLHPDATALEAARFQTSLGTWRKQWSSPLYWSAALSGASSSPPTSMQLSLSEPPASVLHTHLCELVPSLTSVSSPSPSASPSPSSSPSPHFPASLVATTSGATDCVASSASETQTKRPTLAIWCGRSVPEDETWDLEAVPGVGAHNSAEAVIRMAHELAARYRVTVYGRPKAGARSWPTDNPRLVPSTCYSSRDYIALPSAPDRLAASSDTVSESKPKKPDRSGSGGGGNSGASSAGPPRPGTTQGGASGDSRAAYDKFDVMVVWRHAHDVYELVPACRQLHVWVHDMPSTFATKQLVECQRQPTVRSVMFVSRYQARQYFPVGGVSGVPRSAAVLFPKLLAAPVSAHEAQPDCKGAASALSRAVGDRTARPCPASDRDSLPLHMIFVTGNGADTPFPERFAPPSPSPSSSPPSPPFVCVDPKLELASAWVCDKRGPHSGDAKAAGMAPRRMALGSQKVPYKCACVADDDRSLAILLRAWPAARARFPNASLDVYRTRVSPPGTAKTTELTRDARAWRRLGARDRGQLPPTELAHALERSTYWLHPAVCAEASCNAALKAARAGCVPVYVSGGVLDETFADGYSCEAAADYEALLVRAMTDATALPEKHHKMLDANRTRVRERHVWRDVAERWHTHFQACLAATGTLSLQKDGVNTM